MLSTKLPQPSTVQAKTGARMSLYPVPIGATSPGISHFDWLAAVALQGLITHGMEVQADRAMTEEDKDREMAERAYRMANEMLKAREKAQCSV